MKMRTERARDVPALQVVHTPAKINLWLEVLAKRPDGYHDLSSLMLPVALYDTLEVQIDPGDTQTRLEVNMPGVPTDERNLVWRAAQAYFQRTSRPVGLRVRLTKRIPWAAGLGGGSSDAAAILSVLNQCALDPLSPEELLGVAATVGADVPFFLLRRPALATGIGETLEPVDDLPSYPLVLIKPPVDVSTAWAYGRLKLTRGGSRIRIATLLACPRNPAPCLENDLEKEVVSRHPVIEGIKRWLLQNGAVGALMSGSGPTVFGVFEAWEQAQAVESLAKRDRPEWWSAAVVTLTGREGVESAHESWGVAKG
ncbi:4-(cytidine 5'-diphospho)-2-C-methyl-D-erythritol kinase [Desulfacinum hydrothermale]|uniref:4-(cytidine 5'-diphospho)-2-C-methyl-D-erythritol kinase n=1 Tax=Desulfacinum hydrothermale TaxID=109258 RepID=UPI000A03E2CB|nr:4-(cytidine 5'-diphospho)-2-C-methyl-D-erythritol kinase [Desulfacinum hydrothermale]